MPFLGQTNPEFHSQSGLVFRSPLDLGKQSEVAFMNELDGEKPSSMVGVEDDLLDEPGLPLEKMATVEPPASLSAIESRDRKTDPCAETDVWYGSYSGWTMTPSFLFCLGLTVLFAWATWTIIHRSLIQPIFLGLAGSLWLLQAIRWSYRFFCVNYRLTTHRLFLDRGLLYGSVQAVDLTELSQVAVRRRSYEMLLGVGTLLLYWDDNTKAPLILEGVRQPFKVADDFRTTITKARENQIVKAVVSVA